MPGDRRDEGKPDVPRTNLPPEREPYDEGYFGTGEEEGAEREQDAEEAERERARRQAEECAGGDREI